MWLYFIYWYCNTISTYNITINDLYNGIKNILEMTDEDKKKLINKSYNDSLNNYNLFEKRFTNIINSNNFNIKNVNFNKQQNITKDNSTSNLIYNKIFKLNILKYYIKNIRILPNKKSLSNKSILSNKKIVFH